MQPWNAPPLDCCIFMLCYTVIHNIMSFLYPQLACLASFAWHTHLCCHGVGTGGGVQCAGGGVSGSSLLVAQPLPPQSVGGPRQEGREGHPELVCQVLTLFSTLREKHLEQLPVPLLWEVKLLKQPATTTLILHTTPRHTTPTHITRCSRTCFSLQHKHWRLYACILW